MPYFQNIDLNLAYEIIDQDLSKEELFMNFDFLN